MTSLFDVAQYAATRSARCCSGHFSTASNDILPNQPPSAVISRP